MTLRNLALSSTFALAVIAASAQAATINFHFSNNPIWGNVAGTVTGHITGLNANGTSTAAAVWVDSYPAGLVAFGSYPTPLNVMDWLGATVVENTFTLSGGHFVNGHFQITDGNGVNDQLYLNSTTGNNFFDIGSNDTLFVANTDGVGKGIFFSDALPEPGGVPEPASMALLVAGLGGLGVFHLRRK